ncbi:hypothetical protein CONCODRAFT_3871 [Conidiobolus coronatus NRRL 28638]|uniref:Uncharacterized protein n=1 Tax=Conidiobolus coronatus (strain ATCC 28846 / CBS 209.66 / NRRL 28638) TaxID=796925 RepID=A0A137PDW6_CONC2|nr:hypothetical protein CONCODRAFT_3871 [Conidiobolus coronatus NRRL 28638]|eukprot:KXN73203.1 hypothetical protein CONCODRAFT_3871 [Conidiobolus coronatus NRRL 28638]
MYNTFKLSDMGNESPSKKKRGNPKRANTLWSKAPHAEKFDVVKTGQNKPAPNIDQVNSELRSLEAHLGKEAVKSFTSEYVYMRFNAPNTKLELKEEFMQIDPVYENKDEESDSELDEVEEFETNSKNIEKKAEKEIDDIASRFERIKLGASPADDTVKVIDASLDDAVKVIDALVEYYLYYKRAFGNTLEYLSDKVEFDIFDEINNITKIDFENPDSNAKFKDELKTLVKKRERINRKNGGYIVYRDPTAEELENDAYIALLVKKEIEKRREKDLS